MIDDKSPFAVGIDSYSLKPLHLLPSECLEWAAKNGADGVQFSEVNLPPGRAVDETFLKDLSQHAQSRKLYLEWGGGQHIPFDVDTGKPVDLASINRRAAEQAAALGATAFVAVNLAMKKINTSENARMIADMAYTWGVRPNLIIP